jgi:hypothetical protein
MADDPNPHNPGPAPIEPRNPLPGQDANLPGQPPIVDMEKRGRDGASPQRPRRPARNDRNETERPADDSRESSHAESPGHVERELPTDDESRR